MGNRIDLLGEFWNKDQLLVYKLFKAEAGRLHDCTSFPGLPGSSAQPSGHVLAEAMIEPPFRFPSSAFSIPGSELPAHQSLWKEAPCC
jgi:hypothetical protein